MYSFTSAHLKSNQPADCQRFKLHKKISNKNIIVYHHYKYQKCNKFIKCSAINIRKLDQKQINLNLIHHVIIFS